MSKPPNDRRASPLDPEMMSPAERLEEAAGLLATGLLRPRLRHVERMERAAARRNREWRDHGCGVGEEQGDDCRRAKTRASLASPR